MNPILPSEHRHRLHQLAELSGHEYHTADYILEALKVCNPTELWSRVGGTGVVAYFKGEAPGPVMLLRAELDALPIPAGTEVPYHGLQSGVSHRCGHDGHMVWLLGVATYLSKTPLPRGSVYLLFQPAEETGTGAAAVLADPRFAALSFDWVFAMHNLPGYPLGTLVLKEGAITPAVRSLIIRLTGLAAHAAEPELGRNPAYAIQEMLAVTKQLTQAEPDREDFALLTPVYMTLGERAYGVSAGYGELHLTLRAWTNHQMTQLVNACLRQLDRIADAHQLKLKIEWTDAFEANENHVEAIRWAQRAAEKRNMPVHLKKEPLKWGEDFGWFTRHFPGALIGIGAGEQSPALHHPNFNFPDALIEPGIRFWTQLIHEIHAA